MSRSFTIEAIYRSGKKISYSGGRYLSESPISAAKKAFSHASRNMRAKGKLALEIHIRETTRESKHKMYAYKVSRVYNPVTIERGDQEITYKYTVKSKSL